jgi:hypothetical protein
VVTKSKPHNSNHQIAVGGEMPPLASTFPTEMNDRQYW